MQASRGEGILRAIFGGSSTITLPVTLSLLFLGLQHLFLNYIVVACMPVGFEPPNGRILTEIWWQSPDHGLGIPAEFARVNCLFVLYLWAAYRGRSASWSERASTFLLLGCATLFLATQYALFHLLDVPTVPYTLEVIRLAP